MAGNWYGWLVRVPVLDVGLGLLWLRSVHRAWKSAPPSSGTDDAAERALGATVIMGQLSAVITGASIILAAIGAFAALGNRGFLFPESWHLFWAATWAVGALGVAVYTMGVLPTRTPRESFVRSHGVALFCSAVLFFCLAAGVRFLFAVGAIVLF